MTASFTYLVQPKLSPFSVVTPEESCTLLLLKYISKLPEISAYFPVSLSQEGGKRIYKYDRTQLYVMLQGNRTVVSVSQKGNDCLFLKLNGGKPISSILSPSSLIQNLLELISQLEERAVGLVIISKRFRQAIDLQLPIYPESEIR